MNINENYQPAKYVKAKNEAEMPMASTAMKAKKKGPKMLWALLGLLVFLVGGISVYLISTRQTTEPIAPTAPESQPAAQVEVKDSCTLVFSVPTNTPTPTLQITPPPTITNTPTMPPLACGASGCSTDADCGGDYICLTSSAKDEDNNYIKYCAVADYAEACKADPSTTSCCSEPTNTPTPDATATPSATPTFTNTPTPPTGTVTATYTPTVTPTVVVATATPTPQVVVTTVVTNVVTTVGCNESCSANADCSNVSHICYQGRCRLDVNPDDAQCKLASGDTVVRRTVEKVEYVTGPEDWMNYLKLGIGALGLGALLLLLL
jgi:hypothetical protein